MNADPRTATAVAIDGGSAAPIYFQSQERTLFGWLHGAADSDRLGLVLCKPFGFESLSAHLSLRALAGAAADVGVPALRFDYAGTGDSSDIDLECDQIQVWTRDIVAAVDELRRRTHVQRVCVLGIRLGAMLAALAASHSGNIDALIAIAPIISGRRYLRELKTFELASWAEAPPTSAGDGSIEISGFPLHAATIESLTNDDLMTAPAPLAVRDALILDRIDLPAAHAWADRLSSLRISTRYLAIPGFIEMLMRAPHLTVTPVAMISAVRDWLKVIQEAQSGEGTSPLATVAPDPGSGNGPMLLPGRSGKTPTEQPVFIREEPTLFGIVSAPPREQTLQRGVILLNSGGDYHIGPRRMYVSLARYWADRGYVVLRLDLAGLGDSSAPPGQPINDVFPAAAMGDIRTAVEYLRKHHSVGEVTLTGLCSGAYHSFQAALSGLPINRVLLVNPLNFSLSEAPLADVLYDPLLYGRRMLSPRSWKRLLTGQVRFLRLLRVNAHQFWLSIEALLRRLTRLVGMRLPRDLVRQLEALRRAGIRVVFLFSANDPGIKLLRLKSGLPERELGEHFRIRIVTGADHNFTHTVARRKLEELLTEELLATSGEAGSS